MKLPKGIIMVKPHYYLLGGFFILEIYLYYEVGRYVDIMMTARLKDVSDDEQQAGSEHHESPQTIDRQTLKKM